MTEEKLLHKTYQHYLLTMINCLHVDCLHIPPNTLFHSLSLYAHLATTRIHIATAHFDLSLLPTARVLNPNMTLKIPRQYHSIPLVVTPTILNMDLPPASICLQLGRKEKEADLELRFVTFVGVIRVEAHFVEQVTLPKLIAKVQDQGQEVEQQGQWVAQCLQDRFTEGLKEKKRSHGSLPKTQPPTTPPRRSLPHSQGSTA